MSDTKKQTDGLAGSDETTCSRSYLEVLDTGRKRRVFLDDTPDSARIIENIDIAMRADTREQSLAHLEEAHREIETMENEKARLSALYHELLLSVESVHEGESRHETALRYIRERETFSCAPASDSSENSQAQPPQVG